MSGNGGGEPIAEAPGAVLLSLLAVVIVSLTFGLGSTLDVDTVKKTLQRKVPPAVGILCQYTIMPAVAYGLSVGFGFSDAKAVGLLLCGLAPGGSTSNLFAYFLDADLGLSIFMTVSTVLLSIAMMPLLLWLYGTRLLLEEDDEEFHAGDIPYAPLVVMLLLVLVPTLGGIYLRSRSRVWARRAELFGSGLGVLFIAAALVTGIVDNMVLFSSDYRTYLASILLSVIGFSISYAVAAIALKIELSRSSPSSDDSSPAEVHRTCLTIALEVGVQNTILAITATFVVFEKSSTDVLNEALVFPLLCSLWDVANCVVLTLVILAIRRFRRNPSSEEEERKERLPAAGDGTASNDDKDNQRQTTETHETSGEGDR